LVGVKSKLNFCEILRPFGKKNESEKNKKKRSEKNLAHLLIDFDMTPEEQKNLAHWLIDFTPEEQEFLLAMRSKLLSSMDDK
jgi:hypothetical protein